MIENFESKSKKVANYLVTHGTITQWEAIKKFKATRLSAIIFNLKKDGWNIESEMVYEKDIDGIPTRYAIYRFISQTSK